jgi:hypothetical protein
MKCAVVESVQALKLFNDSFDYFDRSAGLLPPGKKTDDN